MWQDILNIVISNGIFAVLFVCLLSYLLKDSSKREQKYTDLIEDLSENVKTAINNKDELDEISNSLTSTHERLEKQTEIIHKVQKDVKVVRKDVKEIKKFIKQPKKQGDNHEKHV